MEISSEQKRIHLQQLLFCGQDSCQKMFTCILYITRCLSPVIRCLRSKNHPWHKVGEVVPEHSINLEEEKTAVTFFCEAMTGRCMVFANIVRCIYKTGAHNLSSDGWAQRTILDANGLRRSKGYGEFLKAIGTHQVRSLTTIDAPQGINLEEKTYIFQKKKSMHGCRNTFTWVKEGKTISEGIGTYQR